MVQKTQYQMIGMSSIGSNDQHITLLPGEMLHPCHRIARSKLGLDRQSGRRSQLFRLTSKIGCSLGLLVLIFRRRRLLLIVEIILMERGRDRNKHNLRLGWPREQSDISQGILVER